MIKRTVRVISKTDCNGRQCFCGFVDADDEVSGITSHILEILDMEDGSNPWILGWPTQIPSLSSESLATLVSGEERRKALGLLTDEQLALIGITRD